MAAILSKGDEFTRQHNSPALMEPSPLINQQFQL